MDGWIERWVSGWCVLSPLRQFVHRKKVATESLSYYLLLRADIADNTARVAWATVALLVWLHLCCNFWVGNTLVKMRLPHIIMRMYATMITHNWKLLLVLGQESPMPNVVIMIMMMMMGSDLGYLYIYVCMCVVRYMCQKRKAPGP